MKLETIKQKILLTQKEFICFDDRFIGNEIKRTGLYEKETSYILYGMLFAIPYPFIFLDIGAHCGYYSSLISGLREDIKCYAFEPVKHIYNLLLDNVKMYPNIIPINCAIGKEVEHNKKIFLDAFNSGASTFFNKDDEKYAATEDVEVKRLTDFDINFKNVKIVKIDIEGNGFEIFIEYFNLFYPGTVFFVEFDRGIENFINNTEIFSKCYVNHSYYDDNLMIIKIKS